MHTCSVKLRLLHKYIYAGPFTGEIDSMPLNKSETDGYEMRFCAPARVGKPSNVFAIFTNIEFDKNSGQMY